MYIKVRRSEGRYWFKKVRKGRNRCFFIKILFVYWMRRKLYRPPWFNDSPLTLYPAG